MICKYYLKDDCNISNISLLKMYNLDNDIYLNILKQNDQKFTIFNKNNETLCKFEISNDKLIIPNINEKI